VPASVTGDALKLVPVNRQASIDIELPNSADLSDVKVTVTGKYHEKTIIKYQFSIVNVLSLFPCINTEVQNLQIISASNRNEYQKD
jgi:peroxiredoxin